MSKSINRRDFLKLSVSGLSALAVSLSPFRLLARSGTAEGNSPVSADVLALCRQAREFFYRKQYDDAAAIYGRLIAAFPSKIEYYDSYAKVFGARQQSLEAAELYLKGMNARPDNPYFKHRLSLSLRRLASGNSKAASAYQNKYGITDLWQHSAELLIAAIALKPVKDFVLDLRDLPAAVEKQNKVNEKYGYPAIVLTEESLSRIKDLTLPVYDKWKTTRSPQRKNFTEAEIDISSKKLKDKKRRDLYHSGEQAEREKAMQKSLKNRYAAGLDAAIAKNAPGQADKYGLKIVNETAGDTQTTGKLRKYYIRHNMGSRLITLNRLLYSRNGNIANALALASALVKYGSIGDMPECRQLVNSAGEYAAALPPVYFACYHIVRSRISIKENDADNARKILLEGIGHFGGYGGIACTMMENYAVTFTKKDAEKGVKIMKALCGKNFDKSMDSAILQYVENYRNSTDFEKINAGEQIKHLYALAKLQKLQGGNDFKTTQAEIAELKKRVKNRE